MRALGPSIQPGLFQKSHHQKFNDKLAVSIVVITDNTGRVVEMSVTIPEVQLTEG